MSEGAPPPAPGPVPARNDDGASSERTPNPVAAHGPRRRSAGPPPPPPPHHPSPARRRRPREGVKVSMVVVMVLLLLVLVHASDEYTHCASDDSAVLLVNMPVVSHACAGEGVGLRVWGGAGTGVVGMKGGGVCVGRRWHRRSRYEGWRGVWGETLAQA
eukprot:364869-Chlamydomonas_euryale.AAC.7